MMKRLKLLENGVINRIEKKNTELVAETSIVSFEGKPSLESLQISNQWRISKDLSPYEMHIGHWMPFNDNPNSVGY